MAIVHQRHETVFDGRAYWRYADVAVSESGKTGAQGFGSDVAVRHDVERLAEGERAACHVAVAQVGEQTVHTATAHGPEAVMVAVADGLRRVYLHEAAFLYQRYAVAERCLVHVRRGDDDGYALRLQPFQHVPELTARHGVNAGGRLVEEQHPRGMYQGARQGQFLLHAARELACPSGLERLNLAVDVGHEVVVLFDGGVEDCGEKPQVLLDREVLVEREAARHIAYEAAYLLVIAHNIEAIDSGFSAVGSQQGGQYAEERGLACAVGADDAVDVALADGEADASQSLRLAVGLGQIGCGYYWHG